jgi:2,3-bisphosphoglycerate-independent phosphoglycerate mutase
MGNSEVGHLNLGAGRIVDQDIRRVDAAIADGTLAANPALTRLIERLKQSGGACHLLGLVSPGGVHSHQDHMVALAGILDRAGIPVAIHAFLDGRDTPPAAATEYLEKLIGDIAGLGRTAIATVCGRYYAMDRDKRWDRVAKAYAMLVAGEGERRQQPVAAVKSSYDGQVTDEFVLPTGIGDYAGMRDGDGIVMANFRADRAREILAALIDPAFDGFLRPRQVNFAAAVGMVAYSEHLDGFLETLFPPVPLDGIMAEVLSSASFASPRPRNTPTSPSSSTAASRPRSTARSASSSPRPRWRPTTSVPKCRRSRSPTGWSRRSPRANSTSFSSITPTRTWSAIPAR